MSSGPLAAALRTAWTRWQLRRCVGTGRRTVVRGTLWVHGGGRIVIGARVELDGRLAPIELHARQGAEIVIGDDARIEGGSSIEAEQSVRIGARARIGRFCKIMDNHFHRVTDRGARPESVPVCIEEGVELGTRAILLPGAHLGRGAVVVAGAVVTRRVPAAAVVAGLPAVVVRS